MFLAQIALTVFLALLGLMSYIAGNPEGGRAFAVAAVISFVLWLIVTGLTHKKGI